MKYQFKYIARFSFHFIENIDFQESTFELFFFKYKKKTKLNGKHLIYLWPSFLYYILYKIPRMLQYRKFKLHHFSRVKPI